MGFPVYNIHMNKRTVYLVGDDAGRFIGDKGLLDLDNARIYNSEDAAERALWKAQDNHQKILDRNKEALEDGYLWEHGPLKGSPEFQKWMDRYDADATVADPAGMKVIEAKLTF